MSSANKRPTHSLYLVSYKFKKLHVLTDRREFTVINVQPDVQLYKWRSQPQQIFFLTMQFRLLAADTPFINFL